VPEDEKQVFVTAHDITPYWHMKMQSAFQQHCDSSISKTINFPHEATADDVRQIFELAIDEDVKGVTVYRDGCRDLQPMALKHSNKGAGTKTDAGVTTESAQAPAGMAGGMRMMKGESGLDELNPIKLPEIMSCLRIRQMTPFGNMHVKVSVDPVAGREREVFAQLAKGGDVANSDLEAICRILSLWLRSNGSLKMAIKQLEGIGSSLSVPTKDGRIMSLADGLATALQRYLDEKEKVGLHGLLLGGAEPDLAKTNFALRAAAPPATVDHGNGAKGAQPRNVSQYKLKCPACTSALSFEEGCVKCHACGFSQC
jgi:ribonucleoside-diphosphate reductase alpha chain